MIIPFFIPHAGCPHQCVFCDQKRITGSRTAPAPASVPAVIERHLGTRKDDTPVEVAFYGGSFTALPADRQRAYLLSVAPYIDAGRVAAIRLSTRPDAITHEILDLLKIHHVTTVELGAQSMADDVLRLSGRGHKAAATTGAVRLLRERGFKTGLQLMPGLPGDTADTFRETVTQVIGLKPDLVRIYPALVIDGTPLARLYRSGAYAPLSLDDAVDICGEATHRFEAAGIAVLRVGLQTTEALDRPGTVLAGPWHPAFGQMVASRRFRDAMRGLLPTGPRRSVTFLVHPSDLSTAIGQRRANIRALSDRQGLDIRVVTDPAVPRGAVRALPSCNVGSDGLL